MSSMHVQKSIKKAESLGGFAAHVEARPLWDLSKRELVEVIVRLGCQIDRPGIAANRDDPEVGVAAAMNELWTLKENGII